MLLPHGTKTSAAFIFTSKVRGTCTTRGFHSSHAEDSGLLGCDSVLLGWCPLQHIKGTYSTNPGQYHVSEDMDPMNYKCAPIFADNMFQNLLRLRETADNTKRYIRVTNINMVKFN
jgi:hypothetical protein